PPPPFRPPPASSVQTNSASEGASASQAISWTAVAEGVRSAAMVNLSLSRYGCIPKPVGFVRDRRDGAPPLSVLPGTPPPRPDGPPGRQQQHRAQDGADDAARPQRQAVPAEQADQQPSDERSGQADEQQLGPVDGLVAGQEQVRDPPGEHAPHEDEQQDHRCSFPAGRVTPDGGWRV